MVTKLPAEVRPLFKQAAAAQGIFQVGINLDFLGELERLDLDESCRHGLHVALGVAEGDPPGANGILVSVSVDTGIDDTSEQIIEDVSETLSIEHPVESSDKDGLLGVQPLTGTSDVVTVSQHPGDDLNLLAPHPPTAECLR